VILFSLGDAETFVTDPTTVEDQKSLPILGSEDFRLRPLRPGDEAALLEYLSQPGVIEHTSIPAPTLESLTASVQRDITAYAKSTSFRFAVAASDDRLIGICGFNSWSPAHRHAELAYELAPQYWGQGVMRRAVVAVLTWGFSELGLNRVHAFVMTSNHRSIRLLERCAFRVKARCGSTASLAANRKTFTSTLCSHKTSPAPRAARRLTRRCSEPLAALMRSFLMTSTVQFQSTLALASGR
jgi:[ribosomal protein S5]-alanine N-acetyltransferase